MPIEEINLQPESPVQPVSESRGGSLSVTEKDGEGRRRMEILVSNIGYMLDSNYRFNLLFTHFLYFHGHLSWTEVYSQLILPGDTVAPRPKLVNPWQREGLDVLDAVLPGAGTACPGQRLGHRHVVVAWDSSLVFVEQPLASPGSAKYYRNKVVFFYWWYYSHTYIGWVVSCVRHFSPYNVGWGG